MKYILSLFLMFLFGVSIAYSQNITYYGEVVDYDSGKDLNGTKVRVLLNGTEVASDIVNKGRYSVQFSAGKSYKIEYSKAGYVSKFVSVDVTKVIEEDMPPGGRIFPPINLDLFSERAGVDFSFLKNEPVVTWYFDHDKMNYDSKQVATVKKKITDKLAEAPNNDAEYNALIQEADQLFNQQKYEAALEKYASALRLPGKEKETHPTNRILEIGDILQKQAEDELDFKQENQAYINLIEAADNLANKKEYAKAIARYEEASQMKSDEQYPKDRIVELREIVEAEKNREKYEELIKRGDMFLKQNSLEAARDRFKEASELMKNEQYPKDKLAEIEGKLDEQSAIREQKEKYNQAVEAADKHFDKEEYEEAIAKYEEALSYESAASYPAERKTMAQTKLDELQAEKEKQEQFEKLVKEGDAGVTEKDYENAVAKYSEALTLFEDDAVEAKKKNAEQLLVQEQEHAEKQAAFDALVEAGDNGMEGKDYATAISKYTEALALINDASVQTKKEEAEQLLAQAEENAEKKADFDALVAAGDQGVADKDYGTAISKYTEALSLIDDASVQTKKEEAEQLLASAQETAEKQAAFDALVAAGDQGVADKDYGTAISKYTEALALMDDASVQTKKEEAEQLLASAQENEEKQAAFDALVEAGDQGVAGKDYDSAITKYTEALAIMADGAVEDKLAQAKQAKNEMLANQAQAETIAELINQAKEKMEAQAYEDAIADYTAALALDAQHAEAIEGKKNAERYLAAANENAEKEEQFNALVEQGDKAFDTEDWEEAKTNYLAAKDIFGDRNHVNNRIDEIQNKLQALANQERVGEEIQTLLDQASNLKMDEKWGQVVQKYEEALRLDGSRSDIATLLEAAKVQKEEWEAAQSKDALFAQLKQDGMHFMAGQKWNEAKVKFEEALAINEDNDILAQLEIIAEKLAESEMLAAQEASYRAKMDEGEAFAGSQAFEQAIQAFNEALNIKKNDPIATSRIKDMEMEMEQLAKQEENMGAYNEAMAAGNNALAQKDYAAAIKHYDDALLVKPADAMASTKKEEAKAEIRALQNEEERYNNLIHEGEELLAQAKTNSNSIPTLQDAKIKFKAAQEMRPEASIPQNKIVEIDNLLRQIEEEEAARNLANAEAQYQEKIELAEVAAQNEQWQNAIDHLEEAQRIKPAATHLTEKIEEYKDKLAVISAANAVEAKYTGLIQQADFAFENQQFEESIERYQAALEIKNNEAYPLRQIEKAKEGMLAAAANAEQQKYQGFINKADEQFAKKQYEMAIASYEQALDIKADDRYAKDKIDEAHQILKNLAENEVAEQAKRAKFDALIADADQRYNGEDYLAAKKIYEQALTVYPNDSYANERAQLCVVKSREKTERENNALYEKVIAKADEYFGVENFDKAEELYKRALSLRSYDRYPQDKIDEIYELRNANVKANKDIEYLGQQSNISIIEGAALLEAGERMREQMKRESVEKELRKNEGIAEDLTAQDLAERHAYQNEIIALRDKRDNLIVDETEKHRIFVDYVDDQVKTLEEKKIQLDNYEKGDITHTYRNIEYIDQEFDEVKRQYGEDHQEIVEHVKGLETAKEIQDRAEQASHRVSVLSTGESLLTTEKRNENLYAINRVKQKDLEVNIDDINKGQELRVFESSNELYQEIKQLEAAALLAETKVSDVKENKLAIHKHLQDDITALDAELQRKYAKGSDDAYDTQLQLDGRMLAAENQYTDAAAGKDNDRQAIVERVRLIHKRQDDQILARTDQHYSETQGMTHQVDVTLNLLDEHAARQKKDLKTIDEQIKSHVGDLDRSKILRDEAKKQGVLNTETEIEQIRKQAELTTKENDLKQKQNSEVLKSYTSHLEAKGQEEKEQVKQGQLNMQTIVEQLETSKLTYTEKIANTIGDEYPEGVSQENYIREDDKGIPYQIVTRRFVVENGHGDIYIRIQTRNGITYSKNGSPITEQGWINGTENAKLKKHF